KVHHGTPSNRCSFWAPLGCHKCTLKERAVTEASRADGARPVWQAVGYCARASVIAGMSPLGEGRCLHVNSILCSPPSLPNYCRGNYGEVEVGFYITLRSIYGYCTNAHD